MPKKVNRNRAVKKMFELVWNISDTFPYEKKLLQYENQDTYVILIWYVCNNSTATRKITTVNLAVNTAHISG